MAQVILAEENHHLVIRIHGRNSKQGHQNDAQKRFISKHEFNVVREFRFLFILSIALDRNMFMAVEIANSKADDADDGHDDRRGKEAFMRRCEHEDDRYEGHAGNELGPDRTGLTSRRHLTSFFDIAGHDAGQGRIRNVSKRVNEAPGHIGTIGKENLTRR